MSVYDGIKKQAPEGACISLYPAEERHQYRAEYHNSREDEYQYPHPRFFLWSAAHYYHLSVSFLGTLAAVGDMVAEDVRAFLFAVIRAPSAIAALFGGLPVRALL